MRRQINDWRQFNARLTNIVRKVEVRFRGKRIVQIRACSSSVNGVEGEVEIKSMSKRDNRTSTCSPPGLDEMVIQVKRRGLVKKIAQTSACHSSGLNEMARERRT